MKKHANKLVGLVAIIQVGIALAEIFLWESLDRVVGSLDVYKNLGFPHGLAPLVASPVARIVANAGLYNGFLAAGLIWTLIDRGGTRRFRVFLLGCVVVAGLFGALTLTWHTLVLQTLPGAAALSAVRLARPVPRRELDREYPPADEEESIDDVIRLTGETLRLGGHRVLRGQHAKSTGAVRARFIVEEPPSDETRFGIFQEARPFDAIVRFSNGTGRVRPDTEKDARGMAIKVLGVEGPRAMEDGEADRSTQDFVMINFPVFAFRDARQYATFTLLKRTFMGLIGPAGNQLAPLVYFVPWHLRQFKDIALKIKKASRNPLEETYWSMSPYRLGPRAVKFLVRPQEVVPPPRPAGPVDGERPADFLSRVIVDQLGERETRFDFLVQFQTDPVSMPVEDATVVWDEQVSRPVKVATLVIERSPASMAEDGAFRESVDAMSFSPWHSVVAHRPIGGINRLRKGVYLANARMRRG